MELNISLQDELSKIMKDYADETFITENIGCSSCGIDIISEDFISGGYQGLGGAFDDILSDFMNEKFSYEWESTEEGQDFYHRYGCDIRMDCESYARDLVEELLQNQEEE